MKKSVLILILMVLFISCSLYDNRVAIAKRHVEEQYLQNQDEFPVKIVGFEKTNGESFESKIWREPGIHKIYKLYYTATFETLTAGYIAVYKANGSARPRIFDTKTNAVADVNANALYGLKDSYEIKEIKALDKIQIKGYLFLKRTENGWMYTPE